MKNSPWLLRFFFSLLAVFIISRASGEMDSLPGFKMMLSNGRFFSVKDIPRGKPVVLIYFAPDCDHCLKLFDVFFPKINELRNAEIVLVTFKPVNDLPPFEKRYQTYKYANMVVGTEGTSFYLRYYYKLSRTPFAAVYDQRGKLVFTSNNPSAAAILQAFKSGTHRKK